ncbi:phosphatidylserine decarboxylase proenzyme, mitochondrial isoform X2 [Aethina tumida]|uniref:phosphatidylserine decarboxylase proenzyme, mitochondrial isoform X2 n=1 Tax=Aethina tumida TaxID=116153 RepID=UPI002148BB6A|nr:phosphatidylserine decarboxylase proenzyme, mitochondrial isoform X2 [Aethina tumida]
MYNLTAPTTHYRPSDSVNSILIDYLIFQGSTNWRGVFTRFLPVGLCLIAVMQWRYYRKLTSDSLAKQWEIDCYCKLPLRTVSRCWGWIADTQLPVFLRGPVYTLYSNTFGVNLSEALNEDLTSYPSLTDFFTRQLKDGVRVIDKDSCVVSPCDGTVLHFGHIPNEKVEQVKGVTYLLKDFLGENQNQQKLSNVDYKKSLLQSKDEKTALYQCVIYLAPGDYHRFHSPTEWKPLRRRHFSGDLLSVNPAIAKWVPGLFCLNERAVYLGEWKHGFFSYTAVGATNVGSVKVYFDKQLQTNTSKKTKQFKEVFLGNSIELKRGDPVGEFRMGSTIVLIFEAPINFDFSVVSGQRVKLGQSLGCLGQRKFVDDVENRNDSTTQSAN